jgi:hypothetical protein
MFDQSSFNHLPASSLRRFDFWRLCTKRASSDVRVRGRSTFAGGPNDPADAGPRLSALLSLFADVVSIEDWIGTDLRVPAEISAEDMRSIAQVAHAVRAGKTRFTGTFQLVGDVEVLPDLESGQDMDIGEDWVVEIFNEEVMLGRRTVHFRPVTVHRGELVEPGRQAVEIEPGPFVEDGDLWWMLTPGAGGRGWISGASPSRST